MKKIAFSLLLIGNFLHASQQTGILIRLLDRTNANIPSWTAKKRTAIVGFGMAGMGAVVSSGEQIVEKEYSLPPSFGPNPVATVLSCPYIWLLAGSCAIAYMIFSPSMLYNTTITCQVLGNHIILWGTELSTLLEDRKNSTEKVDHALTRLDTIICLVMEFSKYSKTLTNPEVTKVQQELIALKALIQQLPNDTSPDLLKSIEAQSRTIFFYDENKLGKRPIAAKNILYFAKE